MNLDGLMAPNAQANVGELMRMNDMLRKAGAGYQSPAGTDPNAGATSAPDAGNYAPLIPQSIEQMVALADFTMEDIVVYKDFVKTFVGQTLHEWAVVEEHGDSLDPWISEGGGGVESVSNYSRDFVRIKYLAEKRVVTDVATQVGLLGGMVNRNALNEATTRGTMSLFKKLEFNLFHGREDLTPLAFDGLWEILRTNAPNNHTDLNGDAAQIKVIQTAIGKLISAPLFGSPDCLYVTPTQYSELVKQIEDKGRFPMVRQASENEIRYGMQSISIAVPGRKGSVEIKSAPFLAFNEIAPAFPLSAVGGTAQTVVPSQPETTSIAAAGAGSNFAAADAGTYEYRVVAMGDGGQSASSDGTNNGGPGLSVAVAAGQSVTITLTASADPTNVKRYVKLYRNEGAGSSIYYLIGQYPVTTNVATVIVDTNNSKPNTSKMILTRQGDPDYMLFVRLLDLIRRPVSDQGTTTRPFLIMLFGSPIVKLPRKCWTFDNCGVNAA